METLELKNLNIFFEEQISYCSKDLNFSKGNEMLKKKIDEIKDLKNNIEILNGSLNNKKKENAEKDSIILRLQYEKKVILEDNNNLRKKVKYLEMKEILQSVINKSLEVISKKEFCISMKKKGSSLKINEFVLKNSKEKLVLFKKSLMNSKKKRKKKIGEEILRNTESIKELRENENKKKKILTKLLKKKEKKKKMNEENFKKSLKKLKKTGKNSDFKKKKEKDKSSKKKDYKYSSNIIGSEKNDLYNFSFSNSDLKIKKKKKKQKNDDENLLKFKEEHFLKKKYPKKSEKKNKDNFFPELDQNNSSYKTASFMNNEELNSSNDNLSKIFLRIKKQFPINSFEIIKNVKKNFNLEDVFFKNDNYPQDEIHKLFYKIEKKNNKHIFFLTLGKKNSGKTYTFQGYKNEPGLLPKISESFNFKKSIYLQIYDFKQNSIFDYLKENEKILNLDFSKNFSNFVKTVKISNKSELNKIFKIIFTKRIKEKISNTLFVRFIKNNKESVTIIDCEEMETVNMNKIKIFKNLMKKDYLKSNSDLLANLLFGEFFDICNSDFIFNFIFHLDSIENIKNNSSDFKCLKDFFSND